MMQTLQFVPRLKISWTVVTEEVAAVEEDEDSFWGDSEEPNEALFPGERKNFEICIER
jgi:hypothetical protein